MQEFTYDSLRYSKPLAESSFLKNFRKLCDLPTSQRQIVKMGLHKKLIAIRSSQPLFEEFKSLHEIPETFHTFVDADDMYCLVHDEYHDGKEFLEWLACYEHAEAAERYQAETANGVDPKLPDGAPYSWGIHRDNVWVLRTPRAPKLPKVA